MLRANRLAMGFAVSLTASALSCGDPGDVRFERRPLYGMITAEAAVECLSAWVEDAGAQVSVGEELGAFRIELPLPPQRWEERAEGLWHSPCFLGFDLRRLEAGSTLLLRGDEPIRELTKPEFNAGEIGFLIRSNALNLRLDAGAELPETLRLVVRYPLAERRDGGWRPLVGGHTGDGIAVPTGTQVDIEADVFPNTFLRFFAIGEPLAIGYKQLDECVLTFRVHLDGELFFEETESVRRLGNGRWHEVALPPAGRLGARLRFSVEGPPAMAAFYQPSLGPRLPESRSLGDPRPDLMLIVLDTLRADALSFYGGDPQIAPALNAFTEECVRFSRAWSSASWTLPSHASMLSSLHPEQHATVHQEHSLAQSHFTLAEHLQGAGYRTGAATEGLFVARRHGLDQGFEFFFENRLRILLQTLEKAKDFLEADDGRPSFLLLHTYRVHTPYRLGIEEDSTGYHALMSQWDTWKKRPDREEASREFGAKLGDLYYGGVSGLDLVLGPWLEDLKASGFYDRGFVILTSDHGDELMDHGNIGHGGRHWEELTHIPMLARGMDLVPQTIDAPATLVDLAPTFSRLAGLEPPTSWMGTSLFELERERVVFTFNSGPRERWMAVHSADRKVFSTMEMGEIRAGRSTAVFDLGRDPLELDDLKDEAPAWASELLKEHADAIEYMLSARSTAVQVELNEEEIEELRALGYGGD
ncbi:MAG: hypothetical protein CMJ89_16960 [Planctomycetes bacterium]|nr:hypothetical protein [Planctomycetota bacterium]